MKFIKSIFIRIDQVIRENQILINYTLCGFLFLGILTQLSSFSSILQFHADHRSIIGTIDNDSAWGISTAEGTTLINDNHRRSYGPVWYRVNYLMRLWADNPLLDDQRNDQQNKEKNIYFTLMLLNLISVYLLAAVLSFVFFDQLRYQLMSTLFIAPALINEKFQATLLIIAKPDHFLSLMVCISFISTALLIRKNFEDKYLKWTAFFWGATLSTKLTAIPFIPVIMMLMFLSQKKEGLHLNKRFLKYLAYSYFLIGFPQNFDFWRNLTYIQDQNRQTSFATGQSLFEWLKVYFDQIFRPGALLILFLILFPLRNRVKDFFQKNLALQIAVLFLIPFCFMLSRKINEPFFRWYTFPFISTGLILLGGIIAFLVSRAETVFIGPWKTKLLSHPYTFLILFFCLPWTLPLNSTTLSLVQKEYNVCRAEAFKTETYVEKAVSNQEYILADVYAPYSAKYEGNWVDSSWQMRTELIIPNKTKWIILKSNYYSGYLTKEEGGTDGFIAHVKDIEKVRSFYRLFWQKEQTLDPYQQSWKKVYSDACGFEVWQREE